MTTDNQIDQGEIVVKKFIDGLDKIQLQCYGSRNINWANSENVISQEKLLRSSMDDAYNCFNGLEHNVVSKSDMMTIVRAFLKTVTMVGGDINISVIMIMLYETIVLFSDDFFIGNDYELHTIIWWASHFYFRCGLHIDISIAQNSIRNNIVFIWRKLNEDSKSEVRRYLEGYDNIHDVISNIIAE
jgi:hypothetical protein